MSVHVAAVTVTSAAGAASRNSVGTSGSRKGGVVGWGREGCWERLFRISGANRALCGRDGDVQGRFSIVRESCRKI